MQWNGAREPMSTASTHSRREGKSLAAMEKRRKGQVLDGTGSRSLNSACRRLSCVGRLSVDLRQQQHSAALWATKQFSLETALLAPHGDGPTKGLTKLDSASPGWLAAVNGHLFLKVYAEENSPQMRCCFFCCCCCF